MKKLRFTSFSSIAGVDQPTIPGVPAEDDGDDTPPLAEPTEEYSDSESEDEGEDEEGDYNEAYLIEDDDPYTGHNPHPVMDQDPIEENSAAPADEQSETAADNEGSIGEEIPHQHQPQLRRSTRQSVPVSMLDPTMTGKTHGSTTRGAVHNQVDTPDPAPNMEYHHREAYVMAHIISTIKERLHIATVEHGSQHVVTYSLKKGIEKFKDRGKAAALKEMKQMHDRECFKPIHKHTLSATERGRALESLIFLNEKRD
eukprot:scaffold11877_cov125-Amphora_coffeaeformis.AAC.1